MKTPPGRIPTRPLLRAAFLDADSLPVPLEPHSPQTVLRHYRSTAPDEILPRLQGVQVVLVNRLALTGRHLSQLPDLQRIIVTAADTGNIDLEAAQRLCITVHSAAGCGDDSVAEHALACWLSLRRHLPTYARAAVDGRWSDSAQFCWHGPVIRPLQGAVLGIVGRGRTGRALAWRAKALGVTVRFAARPGRPVAEDELPLDDLLAQCAALSLHVPLTPDTRGLISAQRLARMAPDAVLINTGHGALVDGPAVLDALRRGRLAGAALDVLDTEPPPHGHPLLQGDVPGLLLTPHVAWASTQAMADLAQRVADLLEEACLAWTGAGHCSP